MDGSSGLVCEDIIQIIDSTFPAFDYCGKVLNYNIGSHGAEDQLREEVEGRRLGNIHCTMITKIHGTMNNSVARDSVGVQNMIYLTNFVHEANLEID